VKLLRVMAVASLAATLTLAGQLAFAQTQTATATDTSLTNTSAMFANSGETAQSGQANPDQEYSPAAMERQLRSDLNQAADQGIDVSEASYLQQLGRQALGNDDPKDAMIDFAIADECLGPYGTMIVNALNQTQIEGRGMTRQQARALERRTVRDTNRAMADNAEVHEALVFENRGLEALQNGDVTLAVKEFRGAETALGPYSSLNSEENGPQASAENSVAIGDESSSAADNANGGTSENATPDEAAATSANDMSSNTATNDWAQQVKQDVENAQSQGFDVADAQYFLSQADRKLKDGKDSAATRDLNAVEGILARTGYQRKADNQQVSNQNGQHD
jgi:hypothetical protein